MAIPSRPGEKVGDFTKDPSGVGWSWDGKKWNRSFGFSPGNGRRVDYRTLNPVLSRGESLLDAPPPNLRTTGEILRYPYEALTDETDYLQIDIRKYDSVATLSGGLTSGGPQRRINQQSTGINPTFGRSAIDATQDRYISLEGNQNRLALSSSGKTKLISGQGSILLPMPSNIQDGNSVSFASGNLDGVTSQVFGNVKTMTTTNFNGPDGLKGAITKLTDDVNRGVSELLTNDAFKKAIITDIQTQAANIPLGGSLTRDAVFARTNGEILNQNVELLFNGVTLRSFKFSFKFTPRGPKEAQQVGLIINTFKKNMAAKVGGSIDANFLGTPNVFELTYKRGASSHPFLHSFKQCVLTDMSVNYTGEGTYAVYDDSTPVSMVLELGFKELEPIYSEDYGSEPGVGY